MQELRDRIDVNASGRAALKHINKLKQEIEYSTRTKDKIEIIECLDSIKHIETYINSSIEQYIEKVEGYLDEYKL